MRFLSGFALTLLVALPAQAAVRVVGTVNGAPLPACNSATGVRYALGTNVFRFTCSEDNLTRQCPDVPTRQIQYTTGSPDQTVTLTCDSATETGLIVDANVIDGTPVVCNAATDVRYSTLTRSFAWTCATEQYDCFPSTNVLYDIPNRRVTLSCTEQNPYIFDNGFEF
jgi:hypothetical protein